MTARTRKAIGSVLIVLFVIVYAVVVVSIGDHVPKLWWAQLIYFVLAGTLWGAPIIPLMTWMHRER